MPKKAAPQPAATDLEAFALGLIWRHGPCTAYTVRKLMADSPSTQWSASAGAIYPLVRRLEKRGLLKSLAARGDARNARRYAATPRGVAALRTWIGPPLPEAAITVAYDPLRSRARFLGALGPDERRAWIAAALDALNVVAERVRRWDELYSAEGDPHAASMTRSGELDVQSRREWLRALAMDQRTPGTPARVTRRGQ